MQALLLLMSLTFLLQGQNEAARILSLSPVNAISHFQMIQPLLTELALKGHDVTVVSHFPRSKPLLNYRDISLKGSVPKLEMSFEAWGIIADTLDLLNFGVLECHDFLSHPSIQELIQSDEQYDLLIVEAFVNDCVYGFVHKFKAPFISYSAMLVPAWVNDQFGNPTDPSYIPDHLCRLSHPMDLMDRVLNVGCNVMLRLGYMWYTVRPSYDVAQKYFGEFVPVEEISRNSSLLLVNSFFGFSGSRPLVPNIIEVGGMHITPLKPLPQDIENFIKGCTAGIVVFSMGSLVKPETLDQNTLQNFLKVFSRLEECVVWRWAGEIQNKPKNVFTTTWLPQSDLLAHPSAKAFISHGGLHGLMETMHCGVPIVGIPLFGDQITNLRMLESMDVAVMLDFQDLSEANIDIALRTVLHNESYFNNAKHLASIMQDRIQSPLQTALYWTEYVIRNRGAPHLRSPGSHLSWVQYLLLDVIAVTLLAAVLLFLLIHYILVFFRIIRR